MQLEKSSLNASFTQFYKSVLDKARERKLHKCNETRYIYFNTSCPVLLTIGDEDIMSHYIIILDVNYLHGTKCLVYAHNCCITHTNIEIEGNISPFVNSSGMKFSFML